MNRSIHTHWEESHASWPDSGERLYNSHKIYYITNESFHTPHWGPRKLKTSLDFWKTSTHTHISSTFEMILQRKNGNPPIKISTQIRRKWLAEWRQNHLHITKYNTNCKKLHKKRKKNSRTYQCLLLEQLKSITAFHHHLFSTMWCNCDLTLVQIDFWGPSHSPNTRTRLCTHMHGLTKWTKQGGWVVHIAFTSL